MSVSPTRFRICTALAFVLAVLMPSASVRAETYNVGVGQRYARIADLPRLKPGDEVVLAKGIYHEMWRLTDSGDSSRPIIIRGAGSEETVFDGKGLNVSGKGQTPRALLQIEGNSVTVSDIGFRNASNGENGAGVRILRGQRITLKNCAITACEMGVMSNDNDYLFIESCRIEGNGNPTGFAGYAHNLYLEGDKTTVSRCIIRNANTGINFKSRGRYTVLSYNWIEGSDEGEISLVDSDKTAGPNANAVLVGNVIISKPNRKGNTSKFIDWGQDTGRPRNGVLCLLHNTFIAADSRIRFIRLSSPGANVLAYNNVFAGSPNLVYRDDAPTVKGWAGEGNLLFPGASIKPQSLPGVESRPVKEPFVNALQGDFGLKPLTPPFVSAQKPMYINDKGNYEWPRLEHRFIGRNTLSPVARDFVPSPGAFENPPNAPEIGDGQTASGR